MLIQCALYIFANPQCEHWMLIFLSLIVFCMKMCTVVTFVTSDGTINISCIISNYLGYFSFMLF